MPGPKFKQGKHACFTWYPEHYGGDPPSYDPEKHQYLVFQGEQCPQTERKHYQGYVQFKKKICLGAAQKSLKGDNKLHMEKVIRTATENRAYCMKTETRVSPPQEFGEFQCVGQGLRSDLDLVHDEIKASTPYDAIEEKYFGTCIRYGKAIRASIARRRPKRMWPMQLHIRWGEAGSGKTRYVYDTHGYDQVYSKPPGKWVSDDYEGQEAFLLDDFDHTKMRLDTFLRLTDRYPLPLQVKGGWVPFTSKFMYITSNVDPAEWYPYANAEQRVAINRRIVSVTHCVRDDATGGRAGGDSGAPPEPRISLFP